MAPAPAPAALVIVLAAAALAACGGGGDGGTPTASPPYAVPVVPDPIVADHLPGLASNLFLPEVATDVPLVVMIPGGSWLTADPAGFDSLARHLAAAGIAALPVEIRAARDGVVHPVPVQDILCAAAYGVATASDRGLDVGPVAVLGHSSGAHLAALAALAPDEWGQGDCPHEPVVPDALVGLAGPYDISAAPDLAEALLGVGLDEDPDAWAAANPLTWTDARPGVPVLLLHGDADGTVPLRFTEDFAGALRDGGHDVRVEILDGVDHAGVYAAENAGDIIAEWVTALP
jgi:acetyl esterase/lipase